jgi:hypothetical protein
MTPASSCGASIGLSDRFDDSWFPLLQLLLACNTSISRQWACGWGSKAE